MKIILFFNFLLLSTLLTAQSGNFSWGKTILGSDAATCKKTITDEDGNMYITGSFKNTISFGEFTLTSGGNADVYLAKLDSNGNAIWAKSFGGSNADEGVVLTLDGSNLYIGGHFEDNITIGSTTFIGAGYRDFFIAKFSDTGNLLWSKKGGGLYYDTLHDICVDNNDKILVTGTFLSAMNVDNISITSKGSYDFFVCKISSEGELILLKGYGGVGDDLARSLITDQQNNIYLTGYIGGTTTFGNNTYTVNGISDIFILKLDNAGNSIWSKTIGGTAYDEGTKIIIDNNSKLYLAGYFATTANFGNQVLTSVGIQDVFVSKLDLNGNFIWTEKAGGPNMDIPYNLIINKTSDQLYMSGIFSGTASFGTNNITSFGNYYNIFVVKLNTSDGKFEWCNRAGGSNLDIGSLALFNDKLYLNANFTDFINLGNDVVLSGSSSMKIFLSQISDKTLTSQEVNSNKIQLYPNPTNGLVKMNITGNIKDIIVRDEIGRIVLSIANSEIIDLTKLPSGIYYLTAVTDKQNFVRKIIKK